MSDVKLAAKRVPRAVREREMLDAAVAEFARAGFHAASMDDVAARAGISKPMVYAYLGTKEDLFIACLQREGTRVMESIVGAVNADLAVDEQLWRGLLAFFRHVAADRDGWTILYQGARGRFADEVEKMRERMVDVVAGMLTRALGARGGHAMPAEVTGLAYGLIGAVESLANHMLDDPSEAPETVAARLMNVVWLGASQLLSGATWPASSSDPRDI